MSFDFTVSPQQPCCRHRRLLPFFVLLLLVVNFSRQCWRDQFEPGRKHNRPMIGQPQGLATTVAVGDSPWRVRRGALAKDITKINRVRFEQYSPNDWRFMVGVLIANLLRTVQCKVEIVAQWRNVRFVGQQFDHNFRLSNSQSFSSSRTARRLTECLNHCESQMLHSHNNHNRPLSEFLLGKCFAIFVSPTYPAN